MATVLVVDDQSVLRLLLRINLERAGYAVVEAPDGRAALDVCEKECPDLVLMDMMMPREDGQTTARKMHDAGFDMPIIFVTARSDMRDELTEDCLFKPFDPKTLLQKVDGYLGA